MERLTQWFGDEKYGREAGVAAHLQEKYSVEALANLYAARLAAYEDTGLEPEDIKELCTDEVAEVARTFRRMIQSGEIAHLQELLNAEQEGRLVVLPCKAGDLVYQHDGTRIYASKVMRWVCETGSFAFDERAIGKTVFLTREEAERALEGGQTT